MSHKTHAFGLLLAALFAFGPASAQAEGPAASTTDIDRLLEVMDMEGMMDGMMAQMLEAQQAMVADTFGQDLSEEERARAQALMASANARIRERMSWQALAPIVRTVYAQVFTKAEVDAMTDFYAGATGQAILRKSPQAMALTMQEMQPLMQSLVQDLQADIRREVESSR